MEKKFQANQYQPDPRQQLFLSHYLDPKSSTFSNAYQSAIKAGYEHEYAKTILNQDTDWLSESIRDHNRLKRAENRLDQIIDLEPVDEEGKIDNSLVANQLKAIGIVTKTSKKYSDKQDVEHSGKIQVEDLSQLSDEELTELAKESESGVSEA